MTEGPLTGRVAVVTGASRGIGAAAAKALAAAGAHVVLVARTVGGLEEVDDAIRSAGGGATLVPQDLRKLDEIDRLGPALAERFRRCDVLVANAAMLGDLSPVAASDPEVWDRTMLVNVTANHRLIRTLDPLLRGSDAGRAVFVTSGVGQRVTPYWGAYAVSKAALEMMVRLYAAEVANTPLRVNLLSPGATRTRMRAAAFPGEDAGTLKTPEAISGLFVDLCSPACARHGEIVRA
jgi:NAD(P)-dependent dehydrogenase (short-subunit alcohol dehydrogenase family)